MGSGPPRVAQCLSLSTVPTFTPGRKHARCAGRGTVHLTEITHLDFSQMHRSSEEGSSSSSSSSGWEEGSLVEWR
eukprot:15999430-Heterocapsa_arctica.AAC.1